MNIIGINGFGRFQNGVWSLPNEIHRRRRRRRRPVSNRSVGPLGKTAFRFQVADRLHTDKLQPENNHALGKRIQIRRSGQHKSEWTSLRYPDAVVIPNTID